MGKRLVEGLPQQLVVDLGGGVKMEMVLVPAGSFIMGDDKSEPSPESTEHEIRLAELEKPAHSVNITKPFYLGKYQVTQEQWEAVMTQKKQTRSDYWNPSKFEGAKNPRECITWDNCQEFLGELAKISAQRGSFALPTEAQWEYACRAGSTTQYCFGDDETRLGDYAWYDANSDGKTHPVGQKKPNAFGLYDMHGNVWEWCEDWLDVYEAKAVTNPTGPTTGAARVARGGGWCRSAHLCHSALRYYFMPSYGSSLLGLRVCLIPANK